MIHYLDAANSDCVAIYRWSLTMTPTLQFFVQNLSIRYARAVNKTINYFPKLWKIQSTRIVFEMHNLPHMVHIARLNFCRTEFPLFWSSRKSGRQAGCQQILNSYRMIHLFDSRPTAIPPLKALLYRIPGIVHRPTHIFYISANFYYLTRQFLQHTSRPHVPRRPKYLH